MTALTTELLRYFALLITDQQRRIQARAWLESSNPDERAAGRAAMEEIEREK